MTAEEIVARIAEIDTLLATGVSSTSQGGVSTAFDRDSLRAERRELQARLSELDETYAHPRPRMFGINMNF